MIWKFCKDRFYEDVSHRRERTPITESISVPEPPSVFLPGLNQLVTLQAAMHVSGRGHQPMRLFIFDMNFVPFFSKNTVVSKEEIK